MPYKPKVSLIYKRLISYILILFWSLFYTGLIYADGGTNDKIRVVVLDAGHGGKDPGALGKNSKEKDIALAITLKLGKYIEENLKDVKVIYTRDKDVFVDLYKRAEIANENNADLFISIHANWWTKTSVSGAETFVMGISKNKSNLEVAIKENSVITMEDDYSTNYEGFDPNSAESYIIFNLVQFTYLNQSLELSAHIQDQFRDRAGRRDRGVKQERFLVLWRTTMPSVLVETGFVTNLTEEKYLMSDEGQSFLASAIYRAVRDYKITIEEKSHFESAVPGQGPAQITPVEQQTEVFFMVQLTTSDKQIALDHELFTGLEVSEFQKDSYYKYAAGKSGSYSDAASLRNNLKDRFRDAFIIAVSEGEIIPMKVAIKHIND